MSLIRCREPFSADVDGVPRTVAAGALVDESDPIVKGREALFETVDDYAARTNRVRPVEAATAEPGEKRSVEPKPERKADKGE